jgi:hypothetical protein
VGTTTMIVEEAEKSTGIKLGNYDKNQLSEWRKKKNR